MSVENVLGFGAHGYVHSGKSKCSEQEIDKRYSSHGSIKILTHEIFSIHFPATPKEKHISEITY